MSMEGWYVIQQGDCLSSLAAKARLPDWKKIYNAPENSEFRRLRPDPNVIEPGDSIFIPVCDVVEKAAATDNRHKYVLKKDHTTLCIVLADEDDQPYANCPYKLSVKGSEFVGNSDNKGLLEHQIDATAETGELEVWWDEARMLHCRWTLQIGHLDPVETVTGQQARLNNMAFEPGPVDGVYGPRTEAAVKRFQTKYELVVDGVAGSITQAKLKEVHGC
jgi:hypothetical protein